MRIENIANRDSGIIHAGIRSDARNHFETFCGMHILLSFIDYPCENEYPAPFMWTDEATNPVDCKKCKKSIVSIRRKISKVFGEK